MKRSSDIPGNDTELHKAVDEIAQQHVEGHFGCRRRVQAKRDVINPRWWVQGRKAA